MLRVRRGSLAAVTLLVAMFVAIGLGTALAAPVPPLGHEGRWITDARGRVVILHGFNVVGKHPPYTVTDFGFGADDLRAMAQEGFNTLRLGVIYTAVEPAPGRYDPAYLDELAATERVAAREGVFTLLDLHQDLYSERFHGQGFPDWAVQTDGLPSEPDLGFPGNYFFNAGLNRAYDNFWADRPGPDGAGLQAHYAGGLRRIAVRFRNRDRLLGYDVMNEPWPGSAWPTCANPAGCPPAGFDQTLLTAFSRRMVRAIHDVDSRHLAWYEPNLQFDVGAATGHGDTGDPKAGLSFHNYCLGAAPGLPRIPDPAGLCAIGEQLVFDNAEAQSRRTGDALLLTEFGATDDPEILERMANLADRNMVGWQNWNWLHVLPEPDERTVISEQGMLRDPASPATPENLKQDKLDVLARPYPQAIAGAPSRFEFDRSARRFELEYRTRGVSGKSFASGDGAETEIFLPARHYPRGGYRVRLSGAEATSRTGARVLRLQACRGVERVSVTVVPARSPVAPATRCGSARRADRGTSREDADGRRDEAGASARHHTGVASDEAQAGRRDGRLALTGLGLAALAAAGVLLLGAGRAGKRRERNVKGAKQR